MPAKRRRKPVCKGAAEDAAMKGRWSGLQEQEELQARNHSEAENCAARRRCREFLEGGWGSIDWHL